MPLSLVIDTAGATAKLDLNGVKLTGLELRANASSVEIGLPSAAGHTAVAVHAKSAVVVVRIPAGVAAWIHGEREMFAVEIDVARFPAVVEHREYRSADYHQSNDRVEVSLSLAGSSVTIV